MFVVTIFSFDRRAGYKKTSGERLAPLNIRNNRRIKKMTENEIRINETTMWREWITVRGLEPITLQDIDDRLAELKQQVKRDQRDYIGEGYLRCRIYKTEYR